MGGETDLKGTQKKNPTDRGARQVKAQRVRKESTKDWACMQYNTIHWVPAVWHTLYKQCLTGITVGIKYYHLDAVNEPIDFQRSWIIFPTFLSLVIAALRFDGIWSLWSFLYATESCLYRVARSLEATLELPSFFRSSAAAAAAKSLQSCPTLWDPIDGSPPGSPVPGILQARTLEWVAISFSNAWKWKLKVKSLSCVQLLSTPWTAAYQAPPSMGFSRQEYWNGVL